MMKAIHRVVSSAIPREELLNAAKNFLLDYYSNKGPILVDNIDSPQFGSSDLLFVNKVKPSVIIVRLNDKDDCEKFIISSISYYLWFKEFMTVSEIFFNAKSGLEMCVFSSSFSAATCRMVDGLSKEIMAHLIKYDVLRVEGLDEPAVYFQQMPPEELVRDEHPKKEGREKEQVLMQQKEQSPPLEISAEELSEFNRLRERYLA